MNSWQLELAHLANAPPRNNPALIPSTHLSALPASVAMPPTIAGNAVMAPATMPPPHMSMMPASGEYTAMSAHHVPISPPLPATAATTSNLMMPMAGKPLATVQPVTREPSWETAISWSDQEEKVS